MKRYPESSAGHITGRILLKKLVPLFAALLVVGCGEKSSSEGSDSAGASAEPSDDAAKPSPVESPSEEPSDTPNSLSDADVERLLKEAVDVKSLRNRDGFFYRDNKTKPYSGWVKEIYDSGQVEMLVKAKDGKEDGLYTSWYENGQKSGEVTYRDGRLDGPTTVWHKNGQKAEKGIFKDGKRDGLLTFWRESGQKAEEGIFKDGEKVSAKYWNSKGEEVETEEEALHE